LTAEPAVRALPPDRLAREHDTWRADPDANHDAERAAARTTAGRSTGSTRAVRSPGPEEVPSLYRHRSPDPGIPR
jgi:exodeoxyribonuclease V alpha subunit